MRLRVPEGYTLLELLVALLIAGGVVALGRITLEAVAQLHQSARATLSLRDSLGIARLALVHDVSAARATSLIPFAGTASSARFASRCPDAFGGFGPCIVLLSSTSSFTVTERLIDGSASRMTVAGVPGRLDYVISGSGEGMFVRNWASSNITPLAIRWTPDRPAAGDTLILPILWGVQ